MNSVLRLFCISCLVQLRLGESNILRGPPSFEKASKLSGSYIPAAMQVIAHDTELMKYVIKPAQSTGSTTTTVRPTPSHNPAVFAPAAPPGPMEYFSKDNLDSRYVEAQQHPSGLNYFERYDVFIPKETPEQGKQLQNIEDVFNRACKYLGKSFADFLKLANKVDSDFNVNDVEDRVLELSKDFEDPDSSRSYQVLRQKQVPPTKAYVTLLSLYDLLNKEAKRLMLNRFSGYTIDVVTSLSNFSEFTSSYQLRSILNKLIESKEIKKADVLKKIEILIDDLDDGDSYINIALKNIPPLVFTL
ncbi:uncharacterized protein ImpE3 [Euwallacea fornicatus]|uniref:uncharacterized protein ImpE3 n=1 Tax=Euwallacea fornicatus TaxID=995702 RepID=UPI00338DCBCE